MKKNYLLRSATIGLLFSLFSKVQAQDIAHSTYGPRNYINAYIGLVDFNLNYEHNIIQRPKSFSNVRVGFGYGQFFVAGEGTYINAALVHLTGRQNSHMEIDLGIKYMVTNSISDPSFSDTFIPDIFLGYRFEKASGGLIFRAGLSYPSIINAGLGYKF